MLTPLARDLRRGPNLLTLSRIVLIFVSAAFYRFDQPVISLVLGVTAGLTDTLDGWLARRTGQVSRIGEILDQFSDVVMESLILFLAVTANKGYDPLLLIAYLFREFWILSIRRFTAEHQVNISSNFLGKLKSNFIGYGSIAAFILIADLWPEATPYLYIVSMVGYIGGLMLGYISAFDYTRQFVRAYNEVCAR